MGAGAVWHKRLRDLEVLFIHESSRLLVSSDCSGTHAAPARSSVFSAAALKWQTHSELNLTPAPRVFKVHCRRQCHGSLTVNIGNKRWLRRSMFDDSHGGVESVCVCVVVWVRGRYIRTMKQNKWWTACIFYSTGMQDVQCSSALATRCNCGFLKGKSSVTISDTSILWVSKISTKNIMTCQQRKVELIRESFCFKIHRNRWVCCFCAQHSLDYDLFPWIIRKQLTYRMSVWMITLV